MERISNKVKQRYLKLVKDGYYLRPEQFSNTTRVAITKDVHDNDLFCRARLTYGYVNKNTAKKFVEMFGFKQIQPVLYFGKEKPIADDELITFTSKNLVVNLLTDNY